MFKKLLTLSLLAVAINATAQTFNKAKMDSVLDVLAANNKTMGSLAISQGSKLIYQKAVGFASVSGQAANVDTKYRIGSISKVFTGVLIMQLVEENKLTLQTTLDKFYPEMPNAAKITIAQLLNHHTGLHNMTNDLAYPGYMTKPQTHEEMLNRLAAMKPDFEPGTKYAYSNTNFVLLGYIVEQLTKKPFAEVVKQRIIYKAGLKNTYYGGKIDTTHNEAVSYSYTGSWKKMPETDMSIPAGAGSMVSTAADLDKFIEALFAGKLISVASLELMKPVNERYGLAMHRIPFDDKKGYGHGGAIDGFLSTMVYYPEDKLAVSYIKNGGNYSPDDVLIAALSIYFNKPYTVPYFKTVASADLDKYLGVYKSDALPIKITVTKDGATLIAQPTGQSSFVLEGTATPDKYIFEAAGVVVEFTPANSQFILKQGGAQYVFTKEK